MSNLKIMQTTDWASGEPMIAAKDVRELELVAEKLAIVLKALVECGGIGSEDLFDDAREAFEQWENLKNL